LANSEYLETPIKGLRVQEYAGFSQDIKGKEHSITDILRSRLDPTQRFIAEGKLTF
jgi:hypothetical protein